MLVGGVGPGPLVYRQRIGVVSMRMKVVLGVSVNQNLGGGVCGPLVYSLRLTKTGISLCKNESSIRCVCVRMGVVCVKGEYLVCH